MSATPRTDMEEFTTRDGQGDPDGYAVSSDFSRQLERELAEANHLRERAESAMSNAHARMSATPRTDQYTGLAFNARAIIETSRQLERELADANEKAAMAESWERLFNESENARNLMRHDLRETINGMDLRELMKTTHPETPVV